MDNKPKNINKTVINKLKKMIKDITKSESIGLYNYDISGNGTAFIKPEDQEKYDTLQQLLSWLDFERYEADKTYIIPGLTIKGIKDSKGKELNMTICISEDNIEKIINNEDKFTKFGIKFPDQIYQFKYKDDLVPGKTYKAPRPRLVEESADEYEAFLKDYYEKNGEQQVIINNGTNVRESYTHEKINYAKGNKIDQSHSSEYYLNYLNRTLKKTQPQPGSQNNPAQTGQTYTFVDSEPGEKIPFPQKIGRLGTTIKTNLTNGSVTKKIRTILGLGVAGGAVALLFSNSIGISLVAVGATAGIGGYFLGKLFKKIKEKAKDLLYGKKQPIPTQQPPQGGPSGNNPTPPGSGSGSGSGNPNPTGGNGQGPSGGNGGNGGNPTPPPTGSGQPSTSDENDIDNLLGTINSNKLLYESICTRIQSAEFELSKLTPGTPEYQQKEQELQGLKQNQKQILKNVFDTIQGYQEAQKSKGGRSL